MSLNVNEDKANKGETLESYYALAKSGSLDATIYLINGICLRGRILDSDERAILLKGSGENKNKGKEDAEEKVALVFKHAISTIIKGA